MTIQTKIKALSSGDKTKNIGLRGVTVADTKISDVDGENGILIYRGYRIEELADNPLLKKPPISSCTMHCRPLHQLEDFSRTARGSPSASRVVLDVLQQHSGERRAHGCAPDRGSASGYGGSGSCDRDAGGEY